MEFKLIKQALLWVLMLLALQAEALEFKKLGGTFSIDGEIVDGDAARFLAELITWKDPPTVFHITSMGGNLDEAMKIGRIIRKSQIPVWSFGECYSACVFIYVAGVERDSKGKIGLHRPYFDKKYFATLDSLEAKEKYEELKAVSIAYLREMEVSQAIIERIFATASSGADVLAAEEANQLLGYRLPFYEEWLMAKCGKYTDEQATVIDSMAALQAARATVAIAKDASIPKSDTFGDNIEQLLARAQLAFQMEKAGKLEPYAQLSKIHSGCEEKAANSHVFAFHRSLKKYLPGE